MAGEFLHIEGSVENVIYKNSTNGYTVLDLDAGGELIPVIGNLGDVEEGEILNVSVPTGNFGDILAGWIAKKMGIPLGRLVCASNKNRVLTDFFVTGVQQVGNCTGDTGDVIHEDRIHAALQTVDLAVNENNRHIQLDGLIQMASVVRNGHVDNTVHALAQEKFHSFFFPFGIALAVTNHDGVSAFTQDVLHTGNDRGDKDVPQIRYHDTDGMGTLRF